MSFLWKLLSVFRSDWATVGAVLDLHLNAPLAGADSSASSSREAFLRRCMALKAQGRGLHSFRQDLLVVQTLLIKACSSLCRTLDCALLQDCVDAGDAMVVVEEGEKGSWSAAHHSSPLC